MHPDTDQLSLHRDVHQHIAQLAQQASIEVNPAAIVGENLEKRIPLSVLEETAKNHREIFVAHLPGRAFTQTLEASTVLAAHGAIPVAHLASRAVPSLRTLAQWLEKLIAQTPTRRLLIIGGSDSAPCGTVDNTSQILDSGLLDDLPLERIYFAAHPEGHPASAQDITEQALMHKQRWALKTQKPVTFVTQFGFDINAILQWERHVRTQLGITLPVRLGLPGPASIKSLVHYAKLCGVHNSLAFLRQRARSVVDLLKKTGPEDQLLPLAQKRLAQPDLLFDSIHVYTLGGLNASQKWLLALQEQKFSICEQALRVELTD